MAANSNTGVPQGAIQASVFNDHVFSLLSGARNVSIGMTLPVGSSGGVNSSTGMILPVGSSGGINSSTGMILPVGSSGGISSSTGMILPVESSGGINSSTGMDPTENSSGMSNMTGLVPGGCSSSGLLLDMVPGLSQDNGMVVDWSIKEQSILEEGLVRYAEESNIMRYIKIAAKLPDKTVRDVALRCRWMTDNLQNDKGKRRKLEDYCTGRKMKDKKVMLLCFWMEKLMDSSLKANIPPSPPLHTATCSFAIHHVNQNDHLSCKVPSVGGATIHLLDENAQVFNQITTNLASFKIQENFDLFYLARNNITSILNDMRNTPGIMSRMSPLPVSLNEELTSIALPNPSQVISQAPAFGAPGYIYLKQEPR
ncbi:hypothetical protein AAC387_Pa04g2209 [Persea americana]